MAEDLVEGWTEPVRQTLKADGSAIDGTGRTITLELRDRAGNLVDVTGKVGWYVQASGSASFTPAAGDLEASRSPYRARWKVTTSGQDVYFPNADADVWTVRR